MKPLMRLLEGKLNDKELELVPRSYDIIGSKNKAVAIIEIPKEIKNRKELIAEAVMKLNKNVKSVLNKISGRKGTYRLEDLELIAGDNNTEVIHKEHGYLLKLDPRKVFFSPREATERQRVASQVRPGENVLVMFSGIGPYAIAIAKKQPEIEKVYCVEINPDAHEYAEENVRINKLAHKIMLMNDNVKKVSSKLKLKFDRIVMPMAVGGEEFLDVAFKLIKDGGMIHFYSVGKEDDLFIEAEKTVIQVALSNRKRIKIENRVKVLPFGVRKHKICLDIRAGVP
ncbi:MAG: class I SAM-dependent methyltransferase family protein [Candidatus Aenigmatarchaeota archaeon]|nr:class I SAM-dependent methyltransferase family protein [Candidatus Aenigmarchaeota archaeon]